MVNCTATMIGPLEKKPSIRIAGYLEKRGKMRVLVSHWKRWWFVLEGRLLLYYKSQMEYLNLSPCRGSINMGLVASVQPSKGLELIVVTRSQSVTLRAGNQAEHEQWLQSLLDAMALPNSANTIHSRPVMHSRYPSQESHAKIVKQIKSINCSSVETAHYEDMSLEHQGSGDSSSSSSNASGLHQTQTGKCLLRRVLSDSRTLLQRPCRRSSVRLTKIAFSDTSIPVSTTLAHISQSDSETNDKCQSMQELCKGLCENENDIPTDHLVDDKGVLINSSKESKLSNSIKIELSLEEDLSSHKGIRMTEQKIGTIKITLDGCAIYGSSGQLCNFENNGGIGRDSFRTTNKSLQNYNDCLVDDQILNPLLHSRKGTRSECNLADTRRMRVQSVSCENVQALDRSIGSTYQDTSAKLEFEQEEHQSVQPRKTRKKRSNSILNRFFERKEVSENVNFERMGTVRKSISFLRNIWKKTDKKTDVDTISNDYESIPVVTELPSPAIAEAEELLQSLGGREVCGPEPEPPPDYDMSLPEEQESPPVLPPRHTLRPPSPSHDVPTNNQLVADKPPPLPLKERQRVRITTSQEASLKRADKLDILLAQLSDVVQADSSPPSPDSFVKNESVMEGDYDVPRPHTSLLGTMKRQTIRLDTLTATHFLCTTPIIDLDSLDPVSSRLDAEISADSLECDSPWSLTHATLPSQSSHSDSMLHHFFASDDKLFPDSLNT